ncbi:hypothetical protein [Thermococcus celer]|uniref:Uncharacterized protein n=1 Tax=Thermococcus celer Vu 13 = JCM 8558 TaxID=1293037 RepID=A0A218P000_THECE|nr:hypothetical protein [Thermococcus celer]ASI98243.1 hypothetical protein A3L02_01000 [Thermococcus celer Vu 13 = JCM 8558]
MDELEFCVKSLSYPLGMILERLERKNGEKVRVGPGSIELPDVPFPALCYLTAVALFDSLDLVDRKRLQDDYDAIERFREKLLTSKLGEGLGNYLKNPGLYVSPGGRISIDWLGFEKRAGEVRNYLKRVLEVWKTCATREGFLEKTGFMSELIPDEGLLLVYLAEDEKLRELINAALGKHNGEFKAAVVRYFKALRG